MGHQSGIAVIDLTIDYLANKIKHKMGCFNDPACKVFKNIKIIFLAHREVFPLDTTFYIKYTKEIPKNTKEMLCECIFHFLTLITTD